MNRMSWLTSTTSTSAPSRGESCQADANQPVPNAGEARTLARRRAADMGGNGVTIDKCAEFSDTPGCLKQVICYGQGAERGRRE